MRNRSSSFAVLALSVMAVGCEAPGPLATDVEPALDHVPGVAFGRSFPAEFNSSGIESRIDFMDDGTDLTIHGVARGMDPTDSYTSLIYDVQSESTGPDACEPAILDPEHPKYILNTMTIGEWVVDAAGNGTLDEVNIVDDDTGERVRVGLNFFSTVSIRAASLGFDLAACGGVMKHPPG